MAEVVRALIISHTGNPASAAQPAQPPAQTAAPNGMLLGSGLGPGPDMTIAEFCRNYHLKQPVFEKLNKNGYDQAQNLRFISLDNLTEMEFLLGEKASLQDAVESWAVHLS